MKIIDQTPFFKENGEISMVDRGKAIMKFGSGWFKEIEAQHSVINVLEKSLDKKFTLMRNVTPHGLGAAIPFILIGPTGVYVMSVTAQIGMFSARGDEWGAISGDTLRPLTPNLLTRTGQMARVVQVFLQRQGYTNLLSVEPVLLCSDPATHIDTVRPIIRVIMRDTLERFAVSIAQGRGILSAESVFDIVNRILNPPATPANLVETAASSVTAAPEPIEPASEQAPTQVNEANVPDQVESAPKPAPEPAYEPARAFSISEQELPPSLNETATQHAPVFPDEPIPDHPGYPEPLPETEPELEQPSTSGMGITRNQWVFLIIMFVIWILIVAVFAFLIFRDFNFHL